ncbi:MAG: DUF4340 domain-containing protein [Taibaiella sp.]|nr:DUF4340 domain-containing protein [Taibaiella sp.]
MRKTLIYIVILAVLGTAIYYLLPGGGESPFDPAEAGFTVKDTSAIGKLFLAAPGGDMVTVERTDSGWVVNKQYPALPSMVNLLLTTIMKQSALYPVPKAAFNNAVEGLATHGTKVEVYDRGGKKMKVFYVGGIAVNNSGTYMMMEGAKQPYVVQQEGFVGYLTPRYSAKLRDWRDRTVFNVAPEDIKSVSLQYAGKPEQSFTVTRGPNDSPVVAAEPRVMNSPDGMNERRASAYLRFFRNVNCEGYLNGLSDNDTTIKTAPKHSSIDMVLKSGKVKHVDIYWMAVNKRSKNQKASDLANDAPEDYDADRMYAIINDYKDTVMIQQLIFHNIFRKAPEFFRKDVVPTGAPTAPGELKAGQVSH